MWCYHYRYRSCTPLSGVVVEPPIRSLISIGVLLLYQPFIDYCRLFDTRYRLLLIVGSPIGWCVVYNNKYFYQNK